MKTDDFKLEFKKLIRDMFESTTSKDWKPWEELDDIKNFYEKFKSEITVEFNIFFEDITLNFRFYYYLNFGPTHCTKEIVEKYDHKMNNPTYEEISEYFKYCARELGYSEDSEMVEIAITAANSMFNGQFDVWKSRKDAKDFKNEYRNKHKRCPKCGSINHTSTLVDYIFNMKHKEDYEDKNHIECLDCGYEGTTHDLIE